MIISMLKIEMYINFDHCFVSNFETVKQWTNDQSIKENKSNVIKVCNFSFSLSFTGPIRFEYLTLE